MDYLLFSYKSNEIMNIESKWMGIEKIVLSEVSQSLKKKYHMLTFIWGSYHQIFRYEYTYSRVTTETNRVKVTYGQVRGVGE